MSRQIEIKFSYGDNVSATRTVRHGGDLVGRFDDLFAEMQSHRLSKLPLDSASKPQADWAGLSDTETSI